MARRRLSDLLREEANKPSEDGTTAAEAQPSADEIDAESSAVAEETTIAPSSTKATTAAKSAAAKRTASTEPEALPITTQDEALLQQIADLTAALAAQKVTVETLQTELEQMHTLKTELEQTRKEVSQLVTSNTKLTQELKALQAQKTEAETETIALEKKAESRPYQELRISSPPIAPTSNPPNAFNKDVGWFD